MKSVFDLKNLADNEVITGRISQPIAYCKGMKFSFAKISPAILFFLSIFLTGQQVLAGLSPRTIRQLDEYYRRVLTDWDLPGMAIGIIYDGQLVFSRGYGVKEIEKPATPDANTLFAIASNTKAITATIIGMLVDEGLLEWDDKVKDHLPYFALSNPWLTTQATIADLLSHRIGFGTFSGDVIWYKSTKSAEEIIRRVAHLQLTHEFRAGYGYSNLMYIVAGEIIEAVTKKKLRRECKGTDTGASGYDPHHNPARRFAAHGKFCKPPCAYK